MINEKLCRICLIGNVKMHPLNENSLKQYFEELIQVFDHENKPKQICYVCTALLIKYWNFRRKCKTTNELLEDAIIYKNEISQKDRIKIGIESSLSVVTNLHNEIIVNEIKNETNSADEDNDPTFYDAEPTKQSSLLWESDDNKPIIGAKEVNSNKEKCVKVKNKSKLKKKIKESKKLVKVKTEKSKEVNPITEQRKKTAQFLKERTTLKLFTQEEVRCQMEKKKDLKSYYSLAFKCDLCYKGFSTSALCNRHMELTHDAKIGPFECDDCKHRFRNKNQLRKHWVVAHSRKYYCNECGHECNNSTQALEHQRQKHMNAKYLCRHCGEEYGCRSSYYQHLRTAHSSDFVCELCGREFENAVGLMKHKKIKHSNQQDRTREDEPRLECEECNIKLIGCQAYNTHMIKKHKSIGCIRCAQMFETESAKKSHKCSKKPKYNTSNSKPHLRHRGLTCHICGVEFANYDSLHFHRKAAHSHRSRPGRKKTKYPCKECGALFVSRLDQARHMKYHTGQVMYKCAFCDLEFAIKRQLDAHMLSHAGAMPFLCSHCGNCYAREAELQRHLRNVESRRQCRVCGEKFENEELAKQHRIEAHPNVRPYPCTVCGKSFNASGHLYLHMTSHAGIKQYGCDRCGKKYRSNMTLRIHIMTVHMKIPDPYHRNDPLKRHRSKVTNAAKECSYG